MRFVAAFVAGLATFSISSIATAQQPAPAAMPIVGRYASPSFYPATLVMTISGVDATGNVTGAVSGMRNSHSEAAGNQSHFQNRDYRPFTYIFGAPLQPGEPDNVVRATLSGPSLAILYGSGARIDLAYNSSGEFSGSLTDPRQPDRDKPVWFHRS